MATYRCVWEFAESNGAQFSEVYYTDENTAELAARAAASTRANRLALLHPLNTWLRIRASNVAQARDTFTTTLNLSGTETTSLGPLPVGAAVVCQLSAPGGGTRSLWLRGCGDDFYRRNATTGKDAPSPNMLILLKAFFASLQEGGWGIRKLTPVSSNPNSNYYRNPIKIVDGTTNNGYCKITLTNAPLYAVPCRVVIGGTNKKDVPALNGHFSVNNVVGFTIEIPYRTPNNGIITTAGGYARLETYSTTNVFNAAASGFKYMGIHDSKNPLSRSRGSRRAARIRQSL